MSLRRIPWWAWVLVGVVAVVGLVAALGGFNDVPITKVRTIPLGSTFHGQEVDSRVLGAKVSASAPDGLRSSKGAWLQVELESVDRTNDPVPIDAISLRTIAGPVEATAQPYATVLTRGGSPIELQPGVPTRMVVLWPIARGAIHDGDRIIVGVLQRVPKTGPTVTNGEYGPPVAEARLQFAVGQTTGAST